MSGAREGIPGRRCFLCSKLRRMPERLDAIEEKLAYLEQAVHELSDVVPATSV